jgi:uncharacterized membrane protein YkvA (DUF1232 family)
VALATLLAFFSVAPDGSIGFDAPAAAQTTDDDEAMRPVDETVSDVLHNALFSLRRFAKQIYFSLSRAAVRWERWLRRLLPFLPIVVIAALADRGLLLAWRQSGIRVLATYVPLMLYVYLRLLLTPRVRMLGKVALLGALVYAVYRHDLITDRVPIPGYVDDAVFIVAATRLFLYTCPERLVASFANDAIGWRRRMATLQRARQR